MMRKLASVALLSLVSGLASAAPCHDVVGTWHFVLACVAHDPPPRFDPRSFDGEITEQEGCVFAGTLPGGPWWIGALAGDGNRTVHSDFGGAKAVGELTARRGGLFTEMTFTYTFSGDEHAPPTACTGTATRL
jgi:hypothetical protein